MRYLIPLLLLAGCAVPPLPPVTAVTGFDFTPYSAKGFLFSPDAYQGPYDAVGLITVTSSAGTEWNGDLQVATPFSPKAILDTLYMRASALGANAVVEFSVRSFERMHNQVTVPGLELSGFAIRRRQP